MKKTYSPTWAYSIIVAIIMIGFLLVVTSSTLNLVLQEMQDGKGKQDYLKAYAGAESALEIWLSHIKYSGYGYYDIQSDLPLLGTSNKDARVSYEFDGKVSNYTGTIPAYGTDIIPLFWIDSTGFFSSITFPTFGTVPEVNWNIIGGSGGISGSGSFVANDLSGKKELVTVLWNQDFSFINTTRIQEFLSSNTGSYMIVYNPTNIAQNYTLESPTDSFFTKPRSNIYSSAKVGKYTQNLETFVDNTEFLGILKYSIYSSD